MSDTRRTVLRSGICEDCQARDLKAMRALESLTPSGSEFVNEVERCVSHIRDNQRSVIHFAKKAKAAREVLERISGLCRSGDYTQRADRLQRISEIVQEALANGIL